MRHDVERGHDLGVAAIEPLGQAQHRRQRPHRAAQRPFQGAVAIVRFHRGRLTMIARQQGNNLDLLRIEPAQLAVLNQVVRVAVVAFVADMDAGIVQQRAVFQPLPLAIPEFVHRACLIEERQRQLRDVARVRGVVAAAFPQLDAAQPTPGAHSPSRR